MLYFSVTPLLNLNCVRSFPAGEYKLQVIDIDIDCSLVSLTADGYDLCKDHDLTVSGPFTIQFTTGSFI